MNAFTSGPKRNYYGKGDVIVYRLYRDGCPNPVFGASVKLLIYGDAFWQTYTTGDNTGLVATDSMENFIQRAAAKCPRPCAVPMSGKPCAGRCSAATSMWLVRTIRPARLS